MVILMSYFLLVIMVLISVAFFTLMERSVLGYVHFRKGPNKVGYVGLFQPFSDVVKLYCKEVNFMSVMNLLFYLMIPFLAVILMMAFWLIFFWSYNQFELKYAFLYFLCVSSLGVYVIFGGGWSSNSKYALLGCYRGLAQVISYEVSLAMLLMGGVFFSGNYGVEQVVGFQEDYWMVWGFVSLLVLWFVSLLAETNRSPFDLSEGESELVSGFNIEYGSYGFAILFMSEYGNIIFMSMITCLLFFGGVGVFCCNLLVVMSMYLLVRGTLVRYRYDKLMMMAWKGILPFSVLLLVILLSVSQVFSFFICVIFSSVMKFLKD
uniref:NADH dehydrogenase subunit 1 n=1 Tax=Otobius lagophilus TaxID=2944767 RepID=UPI002237F983|nr:NADH dehydrogenase subunit 1 [Otobius lagophilus]UYB78391.1 NADH dehydrogenase subunit 1 [Otobius lagophilus]UYB78404.1 NADH dehydrogenase subunit 1 [Otobius lagophilus]UYL27144.1 NADH dehydrogenase subunit 1 [Otobius lagophilus]